MAKNTKPSEEKTNVMRILDGKKIQYNHYCYLDSGVVSGMEKAFRTVRHQSAQDFDKILVSAGKVGYQVELALKDLQRLVRVETADLVAEKEE